MSDIKHLRRINVVIEYDNNCNMAYIYLPPNNSRNKMKVSASKSFDMVNGSIVFDFNNENKLIGIEIPNFDSILCIV